MNVILIILGIILLFALITIAVGHYAFSIHPRPSTETPQSLGLAFKNIYFENDNREILHGWWIPFSGASKDSPAATLVLIHGWNRNCQRMLPFLDILKDLSLNFLVIDGRGHGENARNHFISQVGFAHDIISALDWLVLQPGVNVQKIGVLGHSIGAAAAMYATSLDTRIAAFIADSGYANPREIIHGYLRDYHIPYFPIGWLMEQYIQMRLRLFFNTIAPENAIRKITVPGLILHGTADRVVPYSNSDRILDGTDSSQIKRVTLDGSTHSDSTDHPEFAPAVRGFLSETLLTDSWISKGDLSDLSQHQMN